ncbi:MAG: hypothetical protein LBK60_08710 [Verrucomicrobiales bacterium]|jgi:hypothetical protein|nr:hypothetical protein [Verrucomicrobiales bacterium]
MAGLLLLAFAPLTVARGQITVSYETEQKTKVTKHYTARDFPQDLVRDLFANFGFAWISKRYDEAVSVSGGSQRVMGGGINEATMRYQGDRLVEVRLSVYSRTVMGRWREEPFNRHVDFWARVIQGWAGGKGRELPELEVNDHIIVWKLWRAGPLEYRLERGYSEVGLWGELPEFLNVIIRRVDIPADRHAANPPARVKRGGKGDVWLEVPMIFQGDKGMCTPTAVARVMRYFGADLDKFQLAAILETGSADGGTKTERITPAMRELAARGGFRVTVVQDWQSADFHRSFDAYNRLAAATGKPPLKMPLVWLELNAMDFYRQMDRETFRRSRVMQREELAAFKAAITHKIAAGVPLVWSVVHGLFVERTSGGNKGIYGHTRLIIGINERAGEILYTDSWGLGHELKRMKLEQAFAMSLGLFCLEPDYQSTRRR